MQKGDIQMRTGPRHRTGACGVDHLRQRVLLLGAVHRRVGGGIDHHARLEIRDHRRTALRVGQIRLITAQSGDIPLPLEFGGDLARLAKDQDHVTHVQRGASPSRSPEFIRQDERAVMP